MPGNDDQKGSRNPWGRPNPEKPAEKPAWSKNPGEGDEGPDFEALLRGARARLGNPLGHDGRGLILLIVLAAILWLASGIYWIDSSENAVIQRFGAYTRTQVQPGLGYHLPWPVEKITKLSTTLDRRVQIGFADSGTYNDAQRRDVAEESLMLTADANIVDIDVVVLWNISEAEKFVFNIRNPELTIKRVAESAIRDIVSQTPLQSIITQKRNDVALGVQKLLQAVLDAYGSGVAIKQVLIQGATVHPDVLEAYNDVAASRQDAQRFQNEATIYRNDIIPKARGAATKMRQDAQAYKQEVIAKSQGDAQRFSQILEAYRAGKDVTRDRIYIETMQQVLANANRLIIDQKEGTGSMTVLPLDAIRKNSANPVLDGGQ